MNYFLNHIYLEKVHCQCRFLNKKCNYELNTNNLIDCLNNLFLKGCRFNSVTCVIRSLNIVFIGISIDFVIGQFESN